MVAVLPAMVSVPARCATPSVTCTANGPIRYGPSVTPAAAIASVTRSTSVRSGTAADVPVQRGVDVHAVGDDLHGDPGILQ